MHFTCGRNSYLHLSVNCKEEEKAKGKCKNTFHMQPPVVEGGSEETSTQISTSSELHTYIHPYI